MPCSNVADVWVKVNAPVRYDWTGTYNDAVPVCPQPHPTDVCAKYAHPGTVFPYEDCRIFQDESRGNHSADAVPYLANVVAGFDPRPWHEAACSFAPPTAAQWETALAMAKLQVEMPGSRMGFPDASQPDGVLPAFNIYAFNEYGEGGILAPTQGDGYMKLETVAKVMGR